MTGTAVRTRPKVELPDRAYELIAWMLSQGEGHVAVAAALGVNYRTWMRLRDEDPRVVAAIAEGLAAEEAELVSGLRAVARKGDSTASASVHAASFLLETRHGYRRNSDKGKDAPVNVQIVLPGAVSPERYDALLRGEVVDAKFEEVADDELPDFLR